MFEKMLILHLGNDILHRVVWSFQSHWVTHFREIVFIIKLIYSHKFTNFYWCTLAYTYPPKNVNFSWTFHAPPDPIQCQRMKMSFLPSKTPIFDMLTTSDIDWGPGVQVYKKHCPYLRGPRTKIFAPIFHMIVSMKWTLKIFWNFFLIFWIFEFLNFEFLNFWILKFWFLNFWSWKLIFEEITDFQLSLSTGL